MLGNAFRNAASKAHALVVVCRRARDLHEDAPDDEGNLRGHSLFDTGSGDGRPISALEPSIDEPLC